MKLLYQDAQDTDGSDPSRVINVYQIAGRKVRLSAEIPADQVKSKIAERYGIAASMVDRLDQVETSLDTLDLSSIDALDSGSSVTDLVSAVKVLAGAVRDMRAVLHFYMKEESSQFFE